MDGWEIASLIQSEMLFFCAFFFLLGAIDDLCFDIFYVLRRLTGRLRSTVTLDSLVKANDPLQGRIAVFIPAWDEAAVLAHTIERMIRCFADKQADIFVGCYPNDTDTLNLVRHALTRYPALRLALNHRAGPTTKGDCLNIIWQRMLAEEARTGERYQAVVLHDAEDIPHQDELTVHRHYLSNHYLSQLPVLPIIPRGKNWLTGHYADEFAEAHGKELRVRETMSAALPSAGVGCAFHREFLDRQAAEQDDGPFPSESLVEDYELGLSLGPVAGASVLPLVSGNDGRLVATRAIFPTSLDAIVRQKSRWLVGIALAGWDRLGWRVRPAELWMRMHDRRSIFAAFVIALSYVLFALSLLLLLVGRVTGRDIIEPADGWTPIVLICFANLFYRMTVRALFVSKMHGRRQGMLSVPRTFIANIIAIMASWRAVLQYGRHCFGAPLLWDKTDHRPEPVVINE